MAHRRRPAGAPKRAASTAGPGAKTVQQLRVTLLGSDPPIWRRLLVPSEWTLDDLHEALQRVMGWQHAHTYGFAVGRRWYMPRESFGVDGMWVGITVPLPHAYTHTVRLNRAAPRKGSSLVYVYDLGDRWEHEILVEEILPRTPGMEVPRCTGGERSCPPEDCGGIDGYEDIVKTLRDPNYRPRGISRKELLEWLPEGYSPERFDLAEANTRLSEYEGDR